MIVKEVKKEELLALAEIKEIMDKIEEEIAPKLAAHSDTIRLNPALFGRIKKIYDNRETLNSAELRGYPAYTYANEIQAY